ncbi:uncharacterized protein LOC115765733 [Drosophila novamexicana]|uniref:uncharacterized protein LOC115765733 n=1 Tax=Drosophila novamexicana TaxID=47314 RepID=UPI0011E58EA8|nr:uncharacterized protein LOC115765733 [Drosophila novamexicana]
MVRANRRKGIEEVYGTKLEAMQPARMQAVPQPGMTKTATMRVNSSRQGDTRTQRSYVTANDYYITTNVPLNSNNIRPATSVVTHPSKATQMQMQVQPAAAQVLSYGSVSNRRVKPSARQALPGQQAKVHFMPQDNKANCHTRPHPHTHPYAKSMPMQITQRTVYGQNSELEPNLTELSDKEQMHNTNSLSARRTRGHLHVNPNQPHSHPLQHQLHQQQQLTHPSINSINNNHQMHHMHPNVKHQQQHQHQHQQHQLQLQLQHQQQHQRGPVHPQQHGGMHAPVGTDDDDKDEDPEEFFELIRQTVRKAVGTTISEMVTRNFRDLAGKMERFSNELRMTNENLGKLQNEVTNKVTHYGEENTRHFRYLCMKSEYDKMFYQQQALTAGKRQPPKVAPAPSVKPNPTPPALPTRVAKQAAAFNLKAAKQLTARKLGHGNQKKAPNECVKVQNPCACRSTSKSSHQQPTEEHQSSSEHSVVVKSSELGVREVLGQIQRFCTQMQLSDMKEEQQKYNPQPGLSNMELNGKTSSASANLAVNPSYNNGKPKAHIPIGAPPAGARDMELETPVDSMDEIEIDNFQYSSDEMSSYSDDSEVKFSGSTTARAPLQSSRVKLPIQHSNKGAGDGQ